MSRAFTRAASILALAVCVGAAEAATRGARTKAGEATAKARETALLRLEARYATLLATRRPDLAARYGMPPRLLRFAPLDEAVIDAHARELSELLAEADTLAQPAAAAGASARVDTLRVRIRRELAETAPGGALRRDPLLWLDIVEAAALAPFAAGTPAGCDRTRRAALQLRAVPEALRGAAVLMRGAAAPDSATFRARLARLEALLRGDLPARTDACKEGRRLAEFAEADTLATMSLVEFRRSLAPGD